MADHRQDAAVVEPLPRQEIEVGFKPRPIMPAARQRREIGDAKPEERATVIDERVPVADIDRLAVIYEAVLDAYFPE